MIRLPGLIDPHVHLRDPGQTDKEDFLSGSSAALAGGFTTIIDMPNNINPVITEKILEEKINVAKQKIVCDVGFHFGSLGQKFEEFKTIQSKVLGLKIYLNQTTGNYIVDENVFKNICKAWPQDRPILVHAEENVLEAILEIGNTSGQKIHVCHVSSAKELGIIIKAKEKGFSVTCGVTAHHLFLNSDDEKKLGALGKMKPSLKSKEDVNFIWENLNSIDIIESDHAPHKLEEKKSNNPPYGVPGLETTLPLLLTAMSDGRITLENIRRLCHDNAAKTFGIKTNPNTFIEIDEAEEWTIKNEDLFTKCKWSPFNGWKVTGKVKRVTIRGTKVFEDGKILVKPGFGKIIS
mgnify:CR=1 FL=1